MSILPDSSPLPPRPPQSAGAVCPDCGQRLPDGAAPGFCPVCLFKEMDAVEGTAGEDGGMEAVPLRRMGA